MTTGKLLWGMTWRGAVWGLIFSLVFILTCWILAQIWNSPLLGETRESIFDNNVSSSNWWQRVVIFVFIGLLWGGSIGIPLTLLLGIMGGFLLGIYTRIFHFPTMRRQIYRLVARLGGGIFGFAGELVGLLLIYYTLFSHSISTGYETQTMMIFLSPSIIVGIASIYFANRLTRWYERESAKGITQNVAPN